VLKEAVITSIPVLLTLYFTQLVKSKKIVATGKMKCAFQFSFIAIISIQCCITLGLQHSPSTHFGIIDGAAYYVKNVDDGLVNSFDPQQSIMHNNITFCTVRQFVNLLYGYVVHDIWKFEQSREKSFRKWHCAYEVL